MRRLLAALLCVIAILSLFPTSALAYSTTSNKGVELVYPDEWDYYSTPITAKVKEWDGGKGIYIMPMPESGHGHLGSVKCGSKVTILAENNGYFFFVTSKGYYGWNGKKWFDFKESDIGQKGASSSSAHNYPTTSSKGKSLSFPSDKYYLSEPITAYVRASKDDGAIYLMPKPEKGNGNLGTVRNGQQVSILAEQGDFFFFETADGRYGWNGKKYFYCVFDFVHGGSIQIPGNYSNVSTDEVRAQEGYFYDFYNAKDDMTISLSEVMALEYPEDPEDIIEGEYAFWLDSMPPATYKDKTADSFTLSGYNGNRIYYIQYHVVDDVVYTIEFDCPIKNQDTCSQIVDLVVASFSA